MQQTFGEILDEFCYQHYKIDCNIVVTEPTQKNNSAANSNKMKKDEYSKNIFFIDNEKDYMFKKVLFLIPTKTTSFVVLIESTTRRWKYETDSKNEPKTADSRTREDDLDVTPRHVHQVVKDIPRNACHKTIEYVKNADKRALVCLNHRLKYCWF